MVVIIIEVHQSAYPYEIMGDPWTFCSNDNIPAAPANVTTATKTIRYSKPRRSIVVLRTFSVRLTDDTSRNVATCHDGNAASILVMRKTPSAGTTRLIAVRAFRRKNRNLRGATSRRRAKSTM